MKDKEACFPPPQHFYRGKGLKLYMSSEIEQNI